MSITSQGSNSVYSQNAGIFSITKGAYISTVAPSSTTLNGPNGPFVLGDRILNTTNGNIFYLSNLSTSGGVTSATWLQFGTVGGILPVSQGGTGVNTLTGLALGTGTSGFMGLPFVNTTAWTPNLQINGSSTGINYSPAPTGFYQQVGSVVTFNASINLSSKGSSTGAVTISNMPVATGTNGVNNVIYVITSNVTPSTNYTDIYGVFGTSNTVLTLSQAGPGVTGEGLTNTNVANNSSFLLTGVYFIN